MAMRIPLSRRGRAILPLVALTLCAALLLSGCEAFSAPVFYPLLTQDGIEAFPSSETAWKPSAEDLGLGSMRVVAEDEDAALYFHPKTTEIAVLRKATGAAWYSNPQDRAGTDDALLNAQAVVVTLNRRDVARIWNTFDDSVAYGQFRTTPIDGGISVEYLMGKRQEELLYPAGLTEERFQALLDQMPSDKERSYLKRMYGHVDLTAIPSAQQRDDLKAKFTELDPDLGGKMYALKSLLSKLEQKNLKATLESAGYTAEMRAADEAAVGYAGSGDSDDSFTLAIDYTLENGSLVVRVDPARIRATEKLKVSEITVLRNFGAQKPGGGGTLFVPDGSGAIIDADSARPAPWAEYVRKVYGQDYGVLRTDRVDYSEQTYLPVFGAYGSAGGFLGIAEKDDGQMSVTAGIAQVESGYGFVAPRFTLLTFAFVALESSAKNALNLYPREAVDDPIQLRYLFVDGAGTSYDDLAVAYRNAMIAEGALDGVNGRDGLATAVRAIGAIDGIRSILGYPARIVRELTSFDEARELGLALRRAAPSADVVLSYAGWQRGGLRSGYLRMPAVEPKLGNARRLTELAEALQAEGVVLLPEIEPQYCYPGPAPGGFNPLRQAIRFITRDTGYKPVHDIANFYMESGVPVPYIVRPDLVAADAGSYMERYRALGLGGIGVCALSSELYSDFNARRVLSENDTIGYFRQALEGIGADGTLVGGTGANAYALFALDYAMGLPVTSSNHPILTRSVPFLQIALSGSVSYTMPELDRATDPALYALQAIETGSGVYFDYFADEASAIKDTDFDALYGAAAASIGDLGASVAAEVSAALAPVANRRIVAHERLEEGVYRTTYENGYAVEVNYGRTPWNGIPARGYRVVAP